MPSRAKTVHYDPKNEVTALTSLEHVKDEVHDFGQACQLWAKNYNITKIAQGGYAAIFRLQLRSDTSKYVIAKLMPLKPKTGKGSRTADHTSIQDAATEVKALDAMSEVPGFVGFSEAWVLKGVLPSLFKRECQNWARTHPEDGFACYSRDQLWCFIEMSDAGTDLEQVLESGIPCHEYLPNSKVDKRLLKASQCWDIFWGTAEALGRGEEFSEFEHRDLHPGNVCIKEATPSSSQPDEIPLRKRYTNLEVTLIDYTLSRARLANGEVLANPMRDKSMFEQHVGNPCTQQQHNDNQQYEMYRKMRKLVAGDSLGRKDEAERWQDFAPQTNALWLYHLLSILLKHTGTYDKANTEEDPTKARAGKTRLDTKTVTDRTEVTEDWKIGKSLEKLVEALDPEQSEGPKWESAKALLECEQYWTDEAYEDFWDNRQEHTEQSVK